MARKKKPKKPPVVTEAHKKRVRAHLDTLEATVKKLRDTVVAFTFYGAAPKAGKKRR